MGAVQGLEQHHSISTRSLMMRLTTLGLALIAAATACTSSAVPEPQGIPAVTGKIVARDVTISIGGPPTMHVKAAPNEECGVIFTVRSSTRILRRTATGAYVNASTSDLVVGANAKVWTDVILESCPGQSGAKIIEIF